MALTLAGNGTVSGLDWGASGGGLVLIAEQSFTAASTVSVDNCFTSAYDNYRVLCGLTGSTTGQLVYMRMRGSGSDVSTSTYRLTRSDLAGTYGGATNASASAWEAFLAISTYRNNVQWEFGSPALAAVTSMTAVGTRIDVPAAFVAHGGHTNATAYDGFTIYPASGTITGSLSVYGYTKEA